MPQYSWCPSRPTGLSPTGLWNSSSTRPSGNQSHGKGPRSASLVDHDDAALKRGAKIIKEWGVPLGRQVAYVRGWRGAMGTQSIRSQHACVPLHGLYVHMHECAYVYACVHMCASVRTHMGMPWRHNVLQSTGMCIVET